MVLHTSTWESVNPIELQKLADSSGVMAPGGGAGVGKESTQGEVGEEEEVVEE